MAWYLFDHLALRTALVGRIESSARLAGFTDGAYISRKASRQPNEARARTRLQALLCDRIPAKELKRLLAEGHALSENEACVLALND